MNRIHGLFNKIISKNNNILFVVLLVSFLTNIPSPSGYLLFIKFQFLNSVSDGVKNRALFGTLFELIIDNYNTITVYAVYILILICYCVFVCSQNYFKRSSIFFFFLIVSNDTISSIRD